MFDILHPPVLSVVYYLIVPEEYHPVVSPVAQVQQLRKITFPFTDKETGEKEILSGWMGSDKSQMCNFRDEITRIVPQQDIYYFLFDGAKIHPCYMDFKIISGAERGKIEKRMKAKPP